MGSGSQQCQQTSAQEDEDAEAEEEATSPLPSPEGREPERDGFDSFWTAYPRREAKKAARKAWDRAKDKPALAAILSAIERAKRTEQWLREGGRFIPLPATWLNQGRWDDLHDKPTGNRTSVVPAGESPMLTKIDYAVNGATVRWFVPRDALDTTDAASVMLSARRWIEENPDKLPLPAKS